jgi:hypothetical protein
VGGCAQLRWSATGMRSVSSALLLAKRLRAAALVGDQYAFRYLGAAACEAAARSCAGRRPVCGPFPRRCCLRSGCAQLRWSATGMRSVSSALLLAKRLRAAALVGDRYAVRFLGAAACEAAAAFGSLPVLLATWIFAPPQAGEKDERRFEKRNLCSRVPRLRVHVAVFWSHAKSRAVLGGTLGENAAWCSDHGSSAQEDGCGLSPAAGPARHVVLCGHRSVFSSPPGRQNASPPRIFSTNPHLATSRESWPSRAKTQTRAISCMPNA